MNGLPELVVITDWSHGRDRVLAAVDAALSVSPTVAVQHRHPGANARTFIEEGRALAAVVARHAGRRLFVNGRLDAALLLGADLHLPVDAPRPSEVRPLLPPGRLISAAVHSVEEAKDVQGADFALVSPVFPAGSKPDDARKALGPRGFESVAASLPCPAFALGGIGPETAGQVPAARGLAAVSAVFADKDAAAAVSRLLAAARANRAR